MEGERAATTNLPWVVEVRGLQAVLEGAAVWLINDLEANAYGVAALGPDDLAVLSPGAPGSVGNAAVISAGTGLGEAGLAWDGRRHHPFASEGGHADFAPVDELQIELLRFLMREFGHVSIERVCSGRVSTTSIAFCGTQAGRKSRRGSARRCGGTSPR